jgi:hypothetical protein
MSIDMRVDLAMQDLDEKENVRSVHIEKRMCAQWRSMCGGRGGGGSMRLGPLCSTLLYYVSLFLFYTIFLFFVFWLLITN